MVRRHDLTDAQWAALAPLLPAQSAKGRPPKWTGRQHIDGIRWRIRIGSPWRDVPAEYAPRPTVYGLFRRWQRDGTWDRVLSALRAQGDAQGRIDWMVSVDSMTSRAHQHAADARSDGHLQKEPAGGVHDEPAVATRYDKLAVCFQAVLTITNHRRVVMKHALDAVWKSLMCPEVIRTSGTTPVSVRVQLKPRMGASAVPLSPVQRKAAAR